MKYTLWSWFGIAVVAVGALVGTVAVWATIHVAVWWVFSAQ